MGEIIPFNQVSRGDIATLQQAFAPDTSMVVSSGFPVLSIKGSKWAVVRNGDREVIYKPGTKEPAYGLELCVIAYNKHVSKTYYKDKYEEGSNEKPTCYSNDGIKPGADAEVPQAKSCATCPHNAWGSRITDSGKKAKACTDVRRVAVASPNQLNDPMLLRVPPTSLAPLGEYQAMLAKRNLGIEALVTRVAFDPDASSPLLTFEPVGLISADMVAEIKRMKDELVVQQIIGVAELPKVVDPKDSVDVDDDEDEDEDEAPVAKAEPEPAQPKKRGRPRKVEAEPEDEAPAAKAKPEPKAEPAVGFDDDDDDLFNALDDMLAS